MITLFGSLLGFISAMFPTLFKFWQDYQDKKHEITLLKMQMDFQAQGHHQRIEEINTKADIAEATALYKTYHTGVCWVDALNGTVRPVLAYAFFFLYALTKYLQYQVIASDAPFSVYLDVLWNTEDQAIFAGILSYYFGQRGMAKMYQRK